MTALVGVEAFEGLRLPHSDVCDFEVPINQKPCDCGADAHNARVDAARAAHVAAMGEVERLRAAILATPDPSGCALCGSKTCDRKAAGEVAVANLPASEYEAATERYRLAVADCESRPRIDWPSVLAGLRQIAGGGR